MNAPASHSVGPIPAVCPPPPPSQKPLRTLHFLLLTLPMPSTPEGLGGQHEPGGGGGQQVQADHPQGHRSVPLNKLTPCP